MAALRQEVARLGKLRDTLTRRLRTTEDQRTGLQADMEAAAATKHRLARDLEMSQRQAEADKKAMDELRYERELLKKGMLKVQGMVILCDCLSDSHSQNYPSITSNVRSLCIFK